jgi:TIR domain
MADAGEKLKVFISYSRRDAADFADELVAGLELASLAPFIDRHDIKPGEPWEDQLSGLIAQSDTVVFVVTPEAVKSERCTWEVERTLELSKRLRLKDLQLNQQHHLGGWRTGNGRRPLSFRVARTEKLLEVGGCQRVR